MDINELYWDRRPSVADFTTRWEDRTMVVDLDILGLGKLRMRLTSDPLTGRLVPVGALIPNPWEESGTAAPAPE